MMKKEALILSLCLLMAAPGGMVTMADAPAELEPAIMASAEPVEAQDQKKDADTEEGQPDFKERANAALHPEAAVETSTVQEGDLYIPKDTQIRLELVDPISSKKSKTGSTFKLKTIEDTIINDVVVIPQGEEVKGIVVKAHGNGMFGRGGKLEFNVPYVATINGVKVPVNGYVNAHGRQDAGAVAVAAAVTVVGGLFMKGKNYYYNPGQEFIVTVKEDTDLEATPDNLEEVMDPANQTHGNSISVAAR